MERTNRLSYLLSGQAEEARVVKKGSPTTLICCGKPMCGSKDGFDSIYRLNVSAFVLHSLLAIITIIAGLQGNSPFQVVVTRNLPIVPTPIPFPFNSTQCGSKTYDDVFEWFSCIRDTFGDDYQSDLVDKYGYSVIAEDSGSPDTLMPPFETSYLVQN